VVSPKQRSENLYRQAVSWIQQGHGAEAQDALRQAIGINPANHDARLLLAGLLGDANRSAEASALLRAGLSIVPGHSGFSMALARLQLGSGAKEEALATLEQGLPMAGDDPDYHAFLAALLQKQGRHEEATQHYITALRSNPSMPSWLIGVGISLRATNKMADAAEAFQRAMDTGELSPEVAKFADQQLKQIRQ
jgi:MSHA biogenesis protein MshN